MFDLVVVRLDVTQPLGEVRAEVVQGLEVFLALVDELLCADREEAQVGLVGHHVVNHLPTVLFVRLQLTQVRETLLVGQLTLSARQPRLRVRRQVVTLRCYIL